MSDRKQIFAAPTTASSILGLLPTTLHAVHTVEDVRLGVARFNADAPGWRYARQLIRTTTYWVGEPLGWSFGPSKFVGFAGVDGIAYDNARKGDYTGVPFDGHATRQAIAAALNGEFFERDDLSQRLASWAESIFGIGVFDGVDVSKWKFILLPDDSSLTGIQNGGSEAESVAHDVGGAYRPAVEDQSISAGEPFEVDPEKIERGTRGHALTQNALAAFLRERGLEPRSPRSSEPEFDLAWNDEGIIYVTEVKSLTEANEEKQLRLGLGQVLQYRHALTKHGRRVVAVLVAEREPSDPNWIELCRELDVMLAWPDVFERVVRDGSGEEPAVRRGVT